MASIQKKIQRVRKPRVHLVYDVETGGATVKKELPFVMGVLGDFSGNPETPIKPLRDRKFVQIDRDNFSDVMASMAPELNMRVENTLAGDGSEMAVNLKFKSMDDFHPNQVANQVDSLKKMLGVRNRLGDLIAKADRSADLENLLETALQDPSAMKQLSQELGIGGGAPADPEPPADAGGDEGADESPEPETES